jgi:tetratricopeptide (TPR) repeat protein
MSFRAQRGIGFSLLWVKSAVPFLFFLVASGAAYAAATPQPSDTDQVKTAQQGLDLLMNGEPGAAIRIFKKIASENSESPLGYLMEADATWWKIYLTTGNLIDPDVFEVGSGSKFPYDSRFNSLVDQAISKARANISAKRDVGRNYLYEGMAYGLRGRLAAMRDSNLAAASAAKQMRSLLIEALQHDRNLRDAYAGLGLYDYFVDTLPTIVKLLRWMIGLPGGSRERGLQGIEYAAKYGELTHGEALFYLAKDYSRTSEHQYAKSLELFQQLRQQYPRNGLWTLLVGSLEIRMGHAREGESLYRQVLEQTRGQMTLAGKALHKAALKALKRRHPNGHFE